jgi:hypothetical protein
LFFGGYKTPDRTFNGPHEGFHKAFIVHELKSHVFNGFLHLIQNRKQQHGLEINVGLIDRGSLESQLDGPVLNGNPGMDNLNDGDAHVQSGPQDSPVLSEDGDHGDGALADGDKTGKKESDCEYHNQDKDQITGFHCYFSG